MQNLTQHLKVVGTELAGIQPQVGWHIVVLKQSGGGRVFEKHLQPGEKLNRGILGPLLGTSSYISIPVTGNGRLRHEFTGSVEHASPGHSFEADYVLDFSVASHEKVAIRWAEDPVRRVEEEVKRVVNPITRAADWDELRDSILLDGAVIHFRETVLECLDDVQPFANDYGIHVEKIRMTLRLSKADAQPDEQKAALDRSKRSIEYDKQRRIAEKSADHEVKKLEVRYEDEIHAIQVPGRVREAGVESLTTALRTVGGNATRVEDITRGIREFRSVMSQTGSAALPAAQGTEQQFLVEAASENKLVAAIGELSGVVDSMAGDQTRKRELLCNLLHLMAEAWRGKDAAPEVVEKYAATSKDLVASDWGGGLSAAQHKTLNQFAQFESLRERFK